MKKIMQIICLLVFLYMNRINIFFFLKTKDDLILLFIDN